MSLRCSSRPNETSLKHSEPQMLDSDAYAMQSALKGRCLAALTPTAENTEGWRTGASIAGTLRHEPAILCGYRQEMSLNLRTFACGGCGNIGCRDVNAARNIL